MSDDFREIAKYPSTIYRVSAKAVIKNSRDEILTCKEADETELDLPGSGIEFGETPEEGLRRELAEEVGFLRDFSLKFLYVKTNFKDEIWRMSIVFLCEIAPENMIFEKGIDTTEIEFIAPEKLNRELYSDEEVVKIRAADEKKERE